jgi:hypothetical protein
MTDQYPAVPQNGGNGPAPSVPSAPSAPVWPRIVVATALLAILGAVIGGAVGLSRQRNTQPTAQNQPPASPSVLASPSDDTTAQAGSASCTVDCGQQGNDTKTRTATVPYLIGQDEPTARKWLSDRGLGAQVKYVCNDPGQGGVVIRQSPSRDTTVNTGSNVSLDVRGAQVLHVVNQYYADAKAKLEAAGFNVVVNNRQNGAAGGAVTSQSPSGNSCVKVGSTVTINVGQTNASPSASANGG